MVDSPPADEQVQQVLEEANRLRKNRFEAQITPLTLLEALCTPEVGFTASQLKRFPLDVQQIREGREKQSNLVGALQDVNADESGPIPKQPSSSASTSKKALEKYCKDLTSEAKQGKVDPVIGRDEELKKLVEFLGKRISPNVIITGEPGVGKTAIVGGLALNILNDRVPERLKNASIFELDVNGRLVAGAYKGEVEERLKAVLQEIKALGNAILFIDEIHTLLDPNGSVGSGAVNLLKPELARGELTCIGATTEVEYQKYFESDAAFQRRFSRLQIPEPSEILAIRMLKGLVPRYEAFHGVQLDEDALPLCVQLAKRYLGNKKLPTAALEVQDFTMASVVVMNQTNKMELDQIEKEWLEEVKTLAVDDASYQTKTEALDAAITQRLSHLLTQRLENDQPADTDDSGATWAERFEQKLDLLKAWTVEVKSTVTPEDITATIAYMTGIPMGKIQSEEQKRLLQMEAFLQKRVVGQDQALEMVAQALRRSRAGLREANKPAAAFFFLGPTGTGKTELAKSLADLLFNDQNALIRFDMSEFKEAHSAALLYGSPPGYIGYKEGGLLVNKIRQKPYSVVLFDEIEKAHQSVYDIFLQILDEGMVTDKQGKKGDFSKSIIIFTSNIGSEWMMEQFDRGHIPSKDELRAVMADARMPDGTRAFRPEMLGRGMHLVPFSPIQEAVAGKILDIHLKHFIRLLKNQDIELRFTDAARATLVETGFKKEYGARPLKDTIEERIATPLSEKLIGGEISKGMLITVDWLKDKQQFDWQIEKSLLTS
ncbi:MAG: ATP-dependent Clp protease ATP-binding subunit [Saprospiraceae bacterium]|nr:ATP-dependent Clp protease ATP-binding subunit [Saprospiraceae bacterium]